MAIVVCSLRDHKPKLHLPVLLFIARNQHTPQPCGKVSLICSLQPPYLGTHRPLTTPHTAVVGSSHCKEAASRSGGSRSATVTASRQRNELTSQPSQCWCNTVTKAEHTRAAGRTVSGRRMYDIHEIYAMLFVVLCARHCDEL